MILEGLFGKFPASRNGTAPMPQMLRGFPEEINGGFEKNPENPRSPRRDCIRPPSPPAPRLSQSLPVAKRQAAAKPASPLPAPVKNRPAAPGRTAEEGRPGSPEGSPTRFVCTVDIPPAGAARSAHPGRTPLPLAPPLPALPQRF